MDVEIINLYSNVPMPDTGLIGDHGQSFLIKTDTENILLDVGMSGKKLIHNMNLLNVDPNDISLLILSHGHIDHCGGLPSLLDARTTDEPLIVLAHPNILAPRRFKIGFISKKLKFPQLSKKQKSKMKFDFEVKPRKINDFLRTSGEVIDRSYQQGVEPMMQSKIDGVFSTDLVPDDISVYIETNDGQVIITGCAHAGILNICKNAKESSNKPIIAIIGGTHMVRYKMHQVLATAEEFIDKFDGPDLYLNHCTDKFPFFLLKTTKTIDILKEKYGQTKVKNCYVGSKLIFAF